LGVDDIKPGAYPHSASETLKRLRDDKREAGVDLQGTSALVKLVVAEDESESLKYFLHQRAKEGLFSAALARTELIRAAAPNGTRVVAAAETC
jgi:chromosome segregation and condensation protein ScpB